MGVDVLVCLYLVHRTGGSCFEAARKPGAAFAKSQGVHSSHWAMGQSTLLHGQAAASNRWGPRRWQQREACFAACECCLGPLRSELKTVRCHVLSGLVCTLSPPIEESLRAGR